MLLGLGDETVAYEGILSGMGRMLPTEYVPHVEERIRLLNLRARALGKLGLDDVPGEETLYVQGFNATPPWAT